MSYKTPENALKSKQIYSAVPEPDEKTEKQRLSCNDCV